MGNLAVDYLEDYYDIQNDKNINRFNKRRKRKVQRKQKQEFQLKQIEPMTANQRKVFAQYDKGNNILLHGVAGTGKTFLSLYLALDDLFYGEDNKEKIVVVRSTVPTRDMGFLPGKEQEKAAAYEQPYKAICSELGNRGDTYELLKAKGKIEFMTTSYIRGTTIDDAIIIVDEFQNMSDSEINTVMTRVGVNSRILLCGDFRQTDLNKSWDSSGAKTLLDLWNRMGYNNSHVEFHMDDVVRSGFVRQWLEARNELGLI